ncbi:MAG: DUF4272 domain-containing protein [Planctomyces sp.]|nr:DUF4272 domain-containing protein [Planctomyces sp.]
MAFEPINIFSHKIDPAGVVTLLQKRFRDVKITGPTDDWSMVEVRPGRKRFFARPKVLTFGHNSEYYDGANWPRQVVGMQNYFARFPDAPNKKSCLQLIRSFRFSLAVSVEDLDISSDDERLETLFAVCKHLDGVIFTPTSLRDAQGRILLSADGKYDRTAMLPEFPLTEDHSNAVGNDDEDDQYEDPVRPTPGRIAQRTLALTAVAARATLELDNMNGGEDLDFHRKRIVAWIEELGAGHELEPQEWKVLQRAVGTLEQQDFINAMWRVEGLVVLSWALQLYPMPKYDELVNPSELYSAIGLFDVDAGRRVLAEPDLRGEEELNAMNKHLLALHWRIRDFSIRPESMDFVSFSRNCWFGSFDLSGFRVINGDLAIGDVEISKADPDDLSRMSSLSMERHLAINWLSGNSRIYSETDTST